MATLGLDYVSKAYKAKGENFDYQVKVWDTAGQERFITLTQSFYKQAAGVVVCFDVTNEQSFKDVQRWMDSIDSHAEPTICRVICANKIDMED